MVEVSKKGDDKKYREGVVKLIDLYERDCNMEKIDRMFEEYTAREETIG